jgi:hypothetical protein
MPSLATDDRRFSRLMLTDDGRLSPWLFWAFGLGLLLPVWAGRHFPSEDGMAHLYWVDVFRQLGHAGSAWEPFYQRNAQWNTPNLAYFVVHYALAGIFEAHLALQIFLTLLILGWVASVQYLSTRISGYLGLGAMASLLLIHSSWLYGGFFSLLVGVPLLLVSLGLLAGIFSDQTSPSAPSRFIVLAVLGVVNYYSHFVSACLFLLLASAFIVFFARRSPRKTLFLALAVIPTGLLCLSYFLGGSSGLGGPRWEPVSESVAKFVGQAYFRGFGAPASWFWIALGLFEAVLLVLCFSVLSGARAFGLSPQRKVLLALAVFLVALYFLAPDRVGQGGNLKARMQFATWAWLLPALPFLLSARAQRITLAAICLVLTWQIADFTGRAHRFNVAYDAVLARAASLPEGATLRSSLKYADAGYERSFIRVLAHFTEDIGYHRRAVVVAGYHPARAFYWIGSRPGADTVPAYRLSIVPAGASRLLLMIDPAPVARAAAHQAGPQANAAVGVERRLP